MNKLLKEFMLKSGYAAPEIPGRAHTLAKLIVEHCAGVCEEMGTTVAGCDNGKPTRIADDCATWIRHDFGLG